MKIRTFSLVAAIFLCGLSTLAWVEQGPTATVTYKLDVAVPVLGAGMLLLLGLVLAVMGGMWLRKHPNTSFGNLALSAIGVALLTSAVSGGWLINNAQAVLIVSDYLLSENSSPVFVSSLPATLDNDLDTIATVTNVEYSGCPNYVRETGTCEAGLILSAGGNCSVDAQCVDGVAITVEGVNGDIIVNTSCQVGDHSCQAQQVCESITSEACVHQTYDCATGSQGSWYPQSGAGNNTFNFAYAYDFYNNSDYGNICGCDRTKMEQYGLAQTHQYCGTGHWTRQ